MQCLKVFVKGIPKTKLLFRKQTGLTDFLKIRIACYAYTVTILCQSSLAHAGEQSLVPAAGRLPHDSC